MYFFNISKGRGKVRIAITIIRFHSSKKELENFLNKKYENSSELSEKIEYNNIKFVLNRFSYVFNFNNYAHNICSFYFILTFLYGSAVSASQTDIKKILAYSTISNCGLMFLSFILGSNITGLVFFAIHGWYKSISFLIAGQLVIISNHGQDMRRFYSRYYNGFLQTSHLALTILNLSSFA